MTEGFSAELISTATLGRVDEDLAERMRRMLARLGPAEARRPADNYRALVARLKASRPSTYRHSVRTARYSKLIGRALGFDAARLRQLGATAMLHDVGKLLVPDFILSRPSRPSRVERFVLRMHPRLGELLTARHGLSPELRVRTAHHHERWDGRGYPHGVGGEDIPLLARIVQIADSFDAMVSRRAYNSPRSDADALAELRRESGRQFDPRLTEAFLDSYKGV